MVYPSSELKVRKVDITKSTNPADTFFVMSDCDSLQIIRMIAEQEDLDKAKFGSPKCYYSRLSKLRKTMMIKRKGKAYVLSSFGTILYELVERVRVAGDLHWKLQAIDSLDHKVPNAERRAIIELLVSDEAVRAILLTTCLPIK